MIQFHVKNKPHQKEFSQRYASSSKIPRKLVYKKFTFTKSSVKKFTKNSQTPYSSLFINLLKILPKRPSMIASHQ